MCVLCWGSSLAWLGVLGVISKSFLSSLSFLFSKMSPTWEPLCAEHLRIVGIHLGTLGFALWACGIITHIALRKSV